MERFNALTPGQPGTEAAGIDLEHELTRGFAARCIRRKAREVVRCAGFSPSDRQDIEQELTLVLLRRLGQFNHRVAHYNAFVTTVVERYVATILEHRAAHMRTHQRDGGSLNVLVDDGDGCQIELSATIPSTQHALRTGCHPRSALEQSDLQRDVRDVMATLTPRARHVVLGLVDMILYCDAVPRKDAAGNITIDRVMRTKPHPTYEAGDRTGRLPEILPLDYDAFVKAFTSAAPNSVPGVAADRSKPVSTSNGKGQKV